MARFTQTSFDVFLPGGARPTGVGEYKCYQVSITRGRLNNLSPGRDCLNAQVETIAQQKRLLRQKMLRLRKVLKIIDLQEKSEAICKRLMALPEFLVSRKCLFYLPMEGEINTRPMITGAFDSGKEVYLPLVDTKNRGLKSSIQKFWPKPKPRTAVRLSSPVTSAIGKPRVLPPLTREFGRLWFTGLRIIRWLIVKFTTYGNPLSMPKFPRARAARGEF